MTNSFPGFEADVNDINIVKTSPNFKTGYLLYQLGDEEYKGEVTISSGNIQSCPR